MECVFNEMTHPGQGKKRVYMSVERKSMKKEGKRNDKEQT
jgi:hypothetical protein